MADKSITTESKLVIKDNMNPKVRTKPFPPQNIIDDEEEEAILRILDSGSLSGFRGNWGPNFLGGKEVQTLEKAFADFHHSRYTIAVNSCTSALHIACGALQLKTGDEVIVTPWSMTCSATAPMLWGATPVFADIEEDYFCLDPESVKERTTKRTKAIVVVDLFGQPFDPEIISIAKSKHIPIIEDAAQAIGSNIKGQKAGTLGDIGVFSFTVGKHLTCGEGGMIITNNSELAMRCRLLRNHAEAAVNDMNDELSPYNDMFGFNMRMPEIEAAIMRQQLHRLPYIVKKAQMNARTIEDGLKNIPCIQRTPTRQDCSHSYYVQPFKYNQRLADGIHRDKFIEAVKAELTPEANRENEGVPIGCGYIKPINLMPLFQSQSDRQKNISYSNPGDCPVAERLWKEELFLHRLLGPLMTPNDLDDIVIAFQKVWKYRKELKT